MKSTKRNLKFTSLIILAILFLTIARFDANAQTAITRADVEERALDIINLRWNYTKSRNGVITGPNANIVWQPKQFHGVTSILARGIPYNWGGFDSLDSRSDDAPWGSFLEAINKGAYAGNVNTDYRYGYITGTAGIDCSGFIQAAYNIKSPYKLSTTTMFDKYFRKISIGELKHMDILNKSAWHVAIFDRWGTYNGVYGAYTYEATPEHDFGGIEGTKRYFMTMADINSGYVPGRFVNVTEVPASTYSQTYSKIAVGSYARPINVIDWANYRTSPSSAAPLAGTIPVKTALYLEDYSYGWYKVTYKGKTGWISGGLLGPIPAGTYATVKNVYQLNLRLDPSLSGQIVGALYKYDNVEVLGYSNDGQWWKIRFDDSIGWASSYYLKYVF